MFISTWIVTLAVFAGYEAQSSKIPSFDWPTIEPSSYLEWHKCYSSSTVENILQHILAPRSKSKSRSLSCARLLLPLDYSSTSHENVTLPLLKVSSPQSRSHRGTIILGFGGAGNSRIKDLVTLTAKSDYLDLIDPDFNYDFVTFDNRGFGYSSPSAKCFDTLLDSKLWEWRMADLGGYLNSYNGDRGLWTRIAAAKAKGELCAQRTNATTDIRRHMSTAYAARDMLEIVKRLPDDLKSVGTTNDMDKEVKIPKLKYIGLSYGTMVGQTFASLYPEHMSRMVLDGQSTRKIGSASGR